MPAQLGPELLAVGDFLTDTVWAKGVGWVIAAGLATVTTPGVISSLSQPVTITAGRTYRLVIVVSAMTATALVVRGYSSGSVAFAFGSTIVAAGTYTRTQVATAADTFAIDGSLAAIASIDSVSLRLVL